MKVTFIYKGGRERMMSRREADILQKLGRGTYMTRDMRAQPVVHPDSAAIDVLPDSREPDAVAAPTVELSDELSTLRAEYQEVVGKRPFHGWDAEMLREKIAEAEEGDD